MAESRPWWDRALDPLRSEAAMFRVLLYVIAASVLVVSVVLIVRALL